MMDELEKEFTSLRDFLLDFEMKVRTGEIQPTKTQENVLFAIAETLKAYRKKILEK